MIVREYPADVEEMLSDAGAPVVSRYWRQMADGRWAPLPWDHFQNLRDDKRLGLELVRATPEQVLELKNAIAWWQGEQEKTSAQGESAKEPARIIRQEEAFERWQAQHEGRRDR